MRRQWIGLGAAMGAITLIGGSGIGMAMGAYTASALPSPNRLYYAPPDLGASQAAMADQSAPAPFAIDRSQLAYQADVTEGAAAQPYRAVAY